MDVGLLLTLFHIIGVAVGVGGATVSDVLFFRALSDRRISKDELSLLHTLGMVVWAGLIILIASGVGFLLSQYIVSGSVTYLQMSWFQAKLTIIAILSTNALVMHWYIFPFMAGHLGRKLDFKTMRPKLALFATTGVVSIVSWYSALTLGVTRGLDFSYGLIFNLYLVLLAFGVLVAYTILSVAIFTRPTKNPTVSAHPRGWKVVIIAVLLGLVLVVVSWWLARQVEVSSATAGADGQSSSDHAHH